MTAATRTQLTEQALEKSLEVREEYGYDFRSPLCVYELADRAGVKVQFVDDVSMEGVYAALTRPTVLLSSLRPALLQKSDSIPNALPPDRLGDGQKRLHLPI